MTARRGLASGKMCTGGEEVALRSISFSRDKDEIWIDASLSPSDKAVNVLWDRFTARKRARYRFHFRHGRKRWQKTVTALIQSIDYPSLVNNNILAMRLLRGTV